ncbi:hypothetical protein ACLK1S_06815 [Escherichia coli]
MQLARIPIFTPWLPKKGKICWALMRYSEVAEKLNEHARLGGAKVVWVTDAALLTDAAANALLKTLEEPPAENLVFPGYPRA